MSPGTASSLRFSFLLLGTILAPVPATSGTLDKIRSSHTLKLGIREALIPFSYLGVDQKPVGFSIDLCDAVAERVKTTLKLDALEVVHTPVNPSNRIPLLQNGAIDVECGSTTNTVERQRQVAFSMTIFVSQPKWLVRTDSAIADPRQLSDKKIAITQGSLSLLVAEKIKDKDKLGFSVVQSKDHADSLLLLRTGRVAAWFEEDSVLAGLRAISPEPRTLVMLPTVYSRYFDALMIRKDDAAFKAVVDAAIQEKMASGEFAKLYDKWFVSPIQPSGKNLELPMSEALKALITKPSDSPTP